MADDRAEPLCRSVAEKPAYRTASTAILTIVAISAAVLALRGSIFEAGALVALLVLGISFRAANSVLPSLFTLLFVAAAAVNAFGYVFRLWRTPFWFDEAVHAFTSFTIMAAIGWVMLGRSHVAARHRNWFAALVVALGIGVGMLWELFEYLIGIIGSPRDTVIDLVMDATGAAAAGAFCAWVAADASARTRGKPAAVSACPRPRLLRRR